VQQRVLERVGRRGAVRQRRGRARRARGQPCCARGGLGRRGRRRRRRRERQARAARRAAAPRRARHIARAAARRRKQNAARSANRNGLFTTRAFLQHRPQYLPGLVRHASLFSAERGKGAVLSRRSTSLAKGIFLVTCAAPPNAMEAALGDERDGARLLAPSFAAALDAADELAHLRAQFRVPRAAALAHGSSSGPASGSASGSGPGPADAAAEAVYLCGNSLGLQPARAAAYVGAELDKWAALGVEGHFTAPRPWVTVDETVRAASERLVGARPGAGEVAVMNGLTVNLHLFLVGFFRPPPAAAAALAAMGLPPPPPAAAAGAAGPPEVAGAGAGAGAGTAAAPPLAPPLAPPPPRGRHKILMEAHAFPSDAHAVRSHLALHGLRCDAAAAAAGASSLVELAPRAGEDCLRAEDVEAAIAAHGAELAVVLLPGVQYYTGQLFEVERLTRAAHAAGAVCGWDLAHAAGNVELRLHDWGVDFACWCTYK